MRLNKQSKSFFHTIGTLSLSVFFLASLSSCQKTSKSDGAEFSVLPEKPIVILGDTTDTNGNKIVGPWFNFRVKMTNKTDTKITLTALSLTIYAESATGAITASDSGLSPSAFNFETNTTPSTKCEFVSFGTWDPGESKGLSLEGSCTGYTPVFTIGNGSKGKSGHNFNYRVEVQPQGWFGSYLEPTDRLDTRFNFYTQ